MSHGGLSIDVKAAVDAGPLRISSGITSVLWVMVALGVLGFLLGIITGNSSELVWGAYYTNLCFFMGLAAGSCVIPAIFQIVRAKWSPPVRRIAEAGSAFLPYAFLLWIVTWWGKESLFSWAKAPMPGREWWMQPEFVYWRFGVLLFLLFSILIFYVRLSLRSDVGYVREKSQKHPYQGFPYTRLAANWKGANSEVPEIQRRLSWWGPLVILVYVVVYSLFSFEMIMGMNDKWMSNLFGAFMFIGNIYIGWAMLAVLTVYFVSTNKDFGKVIGQQQLWDLGKLMLGFCMMWAYFFFSQFLCQWYGNLPEETGWMILRTRIAPWREFSWVTFALCFIVPFILLLSEDIKKNPKTLKLTAVLILVGVLFEKFVIIMPELSPHRVPLAVGEVLVDASIFVGFLGAYLLSVFSFLRKYPFIPVSHPLTHGVAEW